MLPTKPSAAATNDPERCTCSTNHKLLITLSHSKGIVSKDTRESLPGMDDGRMDHVQITHNLRREEFRWLWMKYVTGINHARHCTNSLRGRYGRLLSGHNEALNSTPTLILDEQPAGTFGYIYICGVSKRGYPRTNYTHNLHAVIKPDFGNEDTLQFENWQLCVKNGVFEAMPSERDLPKQYKSLPAEFITCRIFRWGVCSTLNVHEEQSIDN